jgi:hypothetical protein
MLYLGGGAREVCLIPFPVRRILMSHPELSRHSTAIEESLKASSRGVLPALQAGGRGSDSQEMAGAVGAAARRAMEAGERDGGSAASRFSRGAGAWYGTMRLFPRGRRWERGAPYAPESCGVGICGGSAVGRRVTV